MLLEKNFEDILTKYPELIEDGLTLKGRQVTLYGRRMDLLFEDKFRRKLIVELKIGPIKDVHIGQVLSYEGMLLSGEDPTIRVMLISNRVPPNIQRTLDHHGIAWREITLSYLKEFLMKRNDDEFLDLFEFYEPASIKKFSKTEPESKVKGAQDKPEQSMTIFQQIKEVLKDKTGMIVKSSDVIEMLRSRFGTNPSSVILSDYCYNRFNDGIKFTRHIFEYLDSNSYKYLGENYPYNGNIIHKPKGQEIEKIVGEWKNGIKFLESAFEKWIGLDQSKYTIKQVFENQKAPDSIEKITFAFHKTLGEHLNKRNLNWFARTHIFGISYFCNDQKTFLWVNVYQKFISIKYFTGNSIIEGIIKANWVTGIDNMGSEPYRVMDEDSMINAVEFAIKAYEIAVDWKF